MNSTFQTAKMILGLGVLLFLTQCQLENDENHIQGLEAEAAMAKLEEGEVTLLDVRTPGEYQQLHIPNAQNINYNSDTFRSAIRTLPKNHGYLLYCESGRRSHIAAKRMKDMGYQQVWHLKDGIEAWENAGLPLRKPE